MPNLELQLESASGALALSMSGGGSALALEMERGLTPTWYGGSYTVTPTGEQQVLPTALTSMREDLTIAPIPSNYGLITWNGTVITVS